MRLSNATRFMRTAILALALGFAPMAGAREILRVLTWPGYADSDLVALFEKNYGVTVEVTYVSSDDVLWEKMNARQAADFDVFAANTAEMTRYIERGLTQPLDVSNIPNTAHQLPRFSDLKSIPGISRNGRLYAIPYTYSEMGLIYDRKQFREPPTSMAAMWDPRFKGRVLAYNGSTHNFSIAALLLGDQTPFRINDPDFKRIVDRLIALRRNVLTFYSLPEESIELFRENSVALMFANYGTQQVDQLRKAGADIGYVIPNEGALAWLDCWAITRGARNKHLAEQWINYMLEKDVSAALTKRQGLANTVEPSTFTDSANRLIWLEPVEDYKLRASLWDRIISGDTPKNSDRIRFGIAFKLGVILATFGVLASGLTGYYSYTASRGLLVKTAEQDLLTSTQVVGRRLSIALGEAAKDARLLAGIPVTAQIAATPGAAFADPRKTAIADIFAALLAVHPEYFQVRLISAGNNGMELVRVDRDQDSLKRVTGVDLQEKGHYPYVFQALRMASGEVYLSKIIINHEQGAHSGLDKPTLQVSTPVESAPGNNAGLVVINVDLNGLFGLLKADLPGDFRVFLTNEAGDFLIHPDPSQTFGFDSGRRVLVQDAFERVAEIVQGRVDSLVTNVPAAHDQAGESVAAFVKLAFGDANANRFVILGLSQPLQNVLRETHLLGINTMQMVLGFSILAIILSVVVSRAMTGPLNMMVRAAKRFSADRVVANLPVTRNDELGLLARSFREMQTQISAHISQLHESRRDVDHLARHDALTGLANRLMLYDRLEHAIAGSQRFGRRIALIFIDLDSFKAVNDALGHTVGDEVLKAVASRLKKMVREIDTVARLGGDEFIILIDSIEDPRLVAPIAQKIIDGFQLPLEIEDRQIPMGVSVGISIYPQDGDNASDLLDKADLAMYRAKKSGGNAFRFSTSAVPDEKQPGNLP